MFDRWTSTTGPPKARSASARTTLVWVSPPGLTMHPALRPRSRLEDVDHRALVVGLLAAHLESERGGAIADRRLDLGEGDRPVDVGLALAEAGEVGSVEQQDRGHRASTASSAPRTSASGTCWPVRGCPRLRAGPSRGDRRRSSCPRACGRARARGQTPRSWPARTGAIISSCQSISPRGQPSTRMLSSPAARMPDRHRLAVEEPVAEARRPPRARGRRCARS